MILSPLKAKIAFGIVAAALLAIAGLLIWALSLKADLADMTRMRGEERASHQTTKDRVATAMVEARRINTQRLLDVKTEQALINEEASRDYQVRIAAARARVDQLRHQAAAADRGGADAGPVPSPGHPARRADPAPTQAGLPATLPLADALIATEQAIQLDALINWVATVSAVDPNRPGAP